MFEKIAKPSDSGPSMPEQCGVLLTSIAPHNRPQLYRRHGYWPNDFVETVVELPNRADDPLHNFRICEGDTARALRWLKQTQDNILGTWHTHHAGMTKGPSPADWAAIEGTNPYWWHCIYNTSNNIQYWYTLTNRDEFLIEDSADDVIPWRAIRVATKPHERHRMGRVQ